MRLYGLKNTQQETERTHWTGADQAISNEGRGGRGPIPCQPLQHCIFIQALTQKKDPEPLTPHPGSSHVQDLKLKIPFDLAAID